MKKGVTVAVYAITLIIALYLDLFVTGAFMGLAKYKLAVMDHISTILANQLAHPIHEMSLYIATKNPIFIILGIAILLYVAYIALKSTAKNASWKTADTDTHGSATWGSLKELANHYFVETPKELLDSLKKSFEGEYTRNGTILGIVNNKVLYQNNSTKPNRNVFVVGGPGSYKTQSVVITNLLNEKNNSIVVTDPKGELYEQTAMIKSKQGYEVHVVNFANMAHSDRFNPFDYIERDVQAEAVATNIVKSENKEGKQDVWFSTQRQLLKALILYVREEREPAQRNLGGVIKVLQQNDVEPEEGEVDSPLDKLFLRLGMESQARRAYELGFKKAKGDMKASIISSLLATLSKFTDNEVSAFTETSDFDLKDIGNKKIALYVIIPVMDDTYESFINLFFTQLFDALYKTASDNGAHLKNEVDFILDEFVNLGHFPKYEEFLATCRGYGIGVTTIVQTITQLQDKYGKDKAESILGNHAVKILLNAANDVTAKYFSELLGKSTVKVETGSESTSHSKETSTSKSDSYSYTSRSLMTSDEIIRMPDNQSVLIFSNQRPLIAKKAFQFELFPNIAGKEKLEQNAYVGQQDATQKARIERSNQEWKAIVEERKRPKDSQESTETKTDSEETKTDSSTDNSTEVTKSNDKATETSVKPDKPVRGSVNTVKKSADDLPMDEDSFEDEWIETVSDDEVGSV